MDGYEQGEIRLSAARRGEIALSAARRRYRTMQIGPAWTGRTIAALMLRLFTRRERCCGYRWKHAHYKDYREGTYLAERTRDRLDYWQFIQARAEQMDGPH